MNARELIDEKRATFVNADTAPTRSIVYTRESDDQTLTLNSFVGGGNFNTDEKDKLEDWTAFGGLSLEQDPQVNDKVTYDGRTFKVQRYTKFGDLWTVYARKSRHSGRPTKG